ncbi:MAG: 3'(2'),5'-bisphosphate nucleotidase CysQ family protein [cyanobacterium endosymbiont of Rhopalodia musculus]|uniref:3'(2'),5'-bisphosphate nucleotidase CysQ family protein n=1 Tax=cyanobacterium endosymbiont of Epithemia clementina EcSB TaxID=3034674 RepID=UPI00247FA1DD|nr:3'(2'),5'-bisphosphate nucleotidase CysQ [cyanobacterium endosymbiont of Epithemia clementina EcSB]WGT68426.1 3'(2'),5'-bisphosphate nucleotidase CysQ [cyanobacterium endosymbiont of Epithemia clementina EcSB]
MLETTQTENLDEIVEVVRAVGWGAAEILRSYYLGEVNQGNIEVNGDKKDGPVTAADLAANHYILEKLQEVFDTDSFGYLSEETYQGTDPIPQDWVWIIDPLDGTRDFIDKTGEYALHIALVYKGHPVVSVVCIPEAERLYFAAKDQGTFVETPDGTVKPIRVSGRNQMEDLFLVVSRTHRDNRFQELINSLPLKNCNYMGSVGGKISTILEQKSDVYVSLSGKSAPKDWDFAAPELILIEAGGKFTNFDGTPLTYNKGDVKQWGGLMASNGHCHELLCQEAIKLLAKIDGK